MTPTGRLPHQLFSDDGRITLEILAAHQVEALRQWHPFGAWRFNSREAAERWIAAYRERVDPTRALRVAEPAD